MLSTSARCSFRRSFASLALPRQTLHTDSSPKGRVVRIVEVGPRDGLQNEKIAIPVEVKVELINRLSDAGMTSIEAGSFVSPRWVPQMAGTKEVLQQMKKRPGVSYSVLVPNMRGLDDYLALADSMPKLPAQEVAVFISASEAFSRANTNNTIAEALVAAAKVAEKAKANNLLVRGYVSVIHTCPYSGRVPSSKVREVTKALVNMGCYEVSLGDTTGTGTPTAITSILNDISKDVRVSMLAGHFHDTFGMALSNIHASLACGLRTFDSSVGGLGGCPYSPGATGNVATEDVVYALGGARGLFPSDADAAEDGWTVEGADLDRLVEIGWWISDVLGRENASLAGRAIKSRREQSRKKAEATKAKL